ncbi:MAG: hemerythrin domain-containing protein [Acidimicrobiales bacterium]|jgi:hypothetical protein|nr:hemerythrin domain-containing protein [Acidimicrobiales bacterium]
MTLTAPHPTRTSESGNEPTLTYDRVTLDLYRDIHKAIRAELFAVTHAAGRTDPADRAARADLARHVADVMQLLVEHAEHEDGPIQPVLEAHRPDLGARIAADHTVLEHRIETLRAQAAELVEGCDGDERGALHRLYVELASFTSAYLAHQDLEERIVMPALEVAVGVPGVAAIHGAIVGPMPPEELLRSLALMLPAMNIDDRAEFFAGFASAAPAEVVEAVWGLAEQVLEPADVTALATRVDR